MLKYDVLCVGSATVDSFLTIEQSLSKVRIGDKIMVRSIEKHSGGGATNSAAALSRLGLKVKMLTKLGDDHDADFVIKDVKNYHVSNICKNRSRHNTDFATIISSVKEKDRIIYVHKGASEDLSPKDVKHSQLNTKWIYLASLLGKSFQTANMLAGYAKRKKIKILFNPSLYLAKKGRIGLKKILDATEILVLNKEEAQALLRSTSKDFLTLLKGLQRCGPKTVVITNGKKGFYALHEGIIYSTTKTPDVKIVHTAGAGDAFTSGLLAGVIKNYPFEESLKLGQADSSSVIQHIGTKNKLLTQRQAKQMIKRYKIKINKKRL